MFDQAEKVVVDSVQTANLPIYDNSEGFANLHIEYARPLTARARAIIDAADEAAAAGRQPIIAPPPDPSPLTQSNCTGRRVLVPKHLWPSWQCDENGGAGWTATVISRRGADARVAYIDATDERGVAFEDVYLKLHVLEPL